ncbi:MAG: hypothetical protein R2729_05250 [Bryobacteraceae bacterium]
MKKFSFPLERLLELRRLQEEMERAKLLRLAAEIGTLDQRRAELARLREGANADLRRTVHPGAEPRVGPLAALPYFRQRVARLDGRMLAERQRLERAAAEQRAELVRARQRSEVLETVRDKSFAEWRAAVDREQESLAGELYLAKWRHPEKGR